MKTKMKFTAIVVSTLLFASCQKNIQQENDTTSLSQTDAGENGLTDRGHGNTNRGFVYTLSNQVAGNKVLVYKRSATGVLTYQAAVPAGGNGTGGGLGNQGALVIAGDGDVLLAVNPGSNTISSFRITGNGLNLKSTVNSGGTTPVSIAQHDGLVYVLNAGGSGNISGFRLGNNDKLTPIPNATKPLSSVAAGAAQVSFVRNGKVLVITEKATNRIITYTVDGSGRPGTMHSITSASPTPFGFAPGRFGNIYVSEAVGGAANASNVSSYQIGMDGSISLTDGPVATGQTAACWVVLTNNNRFIYTTNTGSGSVSSYSVQPYSVAISLKESVAGTTEAGPVDAALTDNSRFLYVLNSGGHSISSFAVAYNGALSPVETVAGLPNGSNGLAAN